MNSTAPVPKKLDASSASSLNIAKKTYISDESLFRFDFNEEQMAVERRSGQGSLSWAKPRPCSGQTSSLHNPNLRAVPPIAK